MEYKITINLDNAAFDNPMENGRNDYRPELARIIRDLAAEVEQASTLFVSLRDINGNRVGKAEVVK